VSHHNWIVERESSYEALYHNAEIEREAQHVLDDVNMIYMKVGKADSMAGDFFQSDRILPQRGTLFVVVEDHLISFSSPTILL
jgi:hypothetical protein